MTTLRMATGEVHPDRVTLTSDERVLVGKYGPGHYRTLVHAGTWGEWAITGPPYPTRTEALVNVPRVARYAYDENVNGPETYPELLSALGSGWTWEVPR